MNASMKQLYKVKFNSLEKELRKNNYFLETKVIGNKHSQPNLKTFVYNNMQKAIYLGSFDELNKQVDNHQDKGYTEILNKINNKYTNK